ncbi:MAG: hypothetical protein RL240_1289, partial [Planctomycetota bacterium]
CPRALPWAIALSPVGAEDQRPVGAMRWFEGSHPLPSGGGSEENVHRLATRGYVVGGEEDVHRLATRGYGWWWRMKSSTVWLRVATGGQKSGALLGAIRWFDRSHRHGEKCC